MKQSYGSIYRHCSLLGCLLLLAASCEEVIDLDLPDPEILLVVEGRIEKIKGRDNHVQQIKLTNNDNFDNNAPAPAVSGATVSVSDGGQTYIFTESDTAAGIYENGDIPAEVGTSYLLTIVYEGDTYQASETMVSVADIDNIGQVFEEENTFEDGGIKVTIDFTDPAGIENFYYWQQLVDGELDVIPDPGNSFNLVADDQFFDGQQIIGFQPNEESVMDPGQEVVVRQIGLSKRAFDFYFLLFEQTGRTGSLFDTPPAPIIGNVINVTNPDKKALGYFGASEVAEAAIIIQEP